MEQGRSKKLIPRDISESLGKLPPQALDLEEAVLGAILLERNALIQVVGFLRVDHFYNEAHRTIYESILGLFAEAEPVDMRTVVMRLRKNGRLELIGGAYKIAELSSKVSSSANIEAHAKIIIELALKRSLILIASEIHHDAYEDTIDVFDLYNRSNAMMQDVLDKAITDRAEKSAKDIAFNVLKDVQGRMQGTHTGLETGYQAIDKLLSGLNKTDLIILAARPGMGKSALALQIGQNVCTGGSPVGVFSLEMGSNQLIERLAMADSELISEKVKRGQIDNHEFLRIQGSLGKVATLPMYVDDTAFLTIVELRARAMRMKAKYGIKLLIVDYLQLIKGIDSAWGKNNRDQEIGIITRTLKGIAKELEIPVIALSQLSREAEKRGKSARPQLSDLRESGSIEQDSDVVVFLWRPEYYQIIVDEYGYPTQGLCEFIVAKHRNGPLDTVRLKFIGKYIKFKEWDGPETKMTAKRENQADYVNKHYKDPTQKLPSESDPDNFKADDLPF